MKYSETYQRRDEHVERLKKFYVIKAEWEDSDGRMDGFVEKFFVIVDNRAFRVVKVNDIGVSRQVVDGWIRFRILR